MRKGERRMTAEEIRDLRVRDDQCAVMLSTRLPDDSACLLPLPCPRHGARPGVVRVDKISGTYERKGNCANCGRRATRSKTFTGVSMSDVEVQAQAWMKTTLVHPGCPTR
jgi:hypothetical protein